MGEKPHLTGSLQRKIRASRSKRQQITDEALKKILDKLTSEQQHKWEKVRGALLKLD